MVRVLVDGIIYRQQHFGGISRCFTEMLTRVGRHCGDIETLLHLPEGCHAQTPKAATIREIRDRHLRPYRLLNRASVAASKAAAKKLRPQIFHSTYYTSPYWPGMKTVVTVYDFIHEQFPALQGEAAFVEQKRREIERADAIIAISDCTGNDVLRYARVDPARITVIPLGVSDAFLETAEEIPAPLFRKQHNIPNPYWLFVGQRNLYKNFGTLLRAFTQISEKTRTDLVLVGGLPELESWQIDLLIRHRLERRIHRLAVSDGVLRQVYANAEGFIFPSLAEGFGIPLLEAMAAGVPIVASDIPVFHEVAGDAALFFDPYDDGALAHAMLRVLDKTTRCDLVHKGRERVRSFTWDEAARKLGQVYRGLA
jgi:glycosyltransferase involved in cell wall biosynthesis